MVERLGYIETGEVDPYVNLALEYLLLEDVSPGECILYLWQNERTVVIGRNQNAADECNLAALEADGGHLARRLSGGGAVYHDLGNLNFTFIACDGWYDEALQTEVILRAVRSLGIEAERTGRNDLVVQGRKFSGHAYRHLGDRSCHHGTLLVQVDEQALSRYLTPSPLKLRARGVSSVRSRVVNLADLVDGLVVEDLRRSLKDAFVEVMGGGDSDMRLEMLDPASFDGGRLEAVRRGLASRDWLFRRERALERSRRARFPWGTVRLDLTVRAGCIREATLWTDGLVEDLPERVEQVLIGCPLHEVELRERLETQAGMAGEVACDLVSLIMDGHEG